MIWRHRTVAAVIVILIVAAGVLVGQGARVASEAAPAVTLDGRPLESGSREVSPRPALGLLLPPGSRLSDFRASLDGHPVPVRAATGRTAAMDVGQLPQGSSHHLEVWRGAIGPARVGTVRVDFEVTPPLELAASWLTGARRTTVQVSASRQLADSGAVESALARAGAEVRHDDRGVEGRWPAGRVPAFTIGAGLRATTGAFLASDFSPSLGSARGAGYSRVDLSSAPPPPPTGLRLRAYYVAGPAARSDLARHVARISVLSPSFYSVDGEGTLARTVDEQALATARDAGVSVEPLLTNKDFSPAAARALFASPAAADGLATALLAEAARRGYSGYQLDFEGLGYGDRDALSSFSARLSSRLREARLNYSTAVIPTKDPGSGAGLSQLFGHSGVYDYGRLARAATSISVMAYDQHTSASEPGPVAGLDWVRQVARATTNGLDPSRVYLGIPLYYRDWPARGAATAGGYGDLVSTAAAADGTVSWDFASASPYVRYSAPGEEHVAWTENATSLQAKLRVAHDMGFAGVAAWRLGLEDPGFWDAW